MPKLVDRDARRRDVVDALFRIVVRDGLQRASLRAVADEAALNIGSVRHYFASQQELMRFAMESMLERVSARLMRRVDAIGGLAGHPQAAQYRLAADLLGELLPLDDLRRAEVTVFLDFTAAARTEPAFADLSRKAATGTRALIHRVLARLADDGSLGPARDVPAETERLAALIDGLGLTAVLHPTVVTPTVCTDTLRAHLAELAAAAPAAA
ncbi:TetR/AcrR family transcriptional regulator [Streptomyces sp. NBC_01525]|uniref:TetR/AcrR family transcriptional regulator n=1 Tax=Streptomyces sp. NBC_01525 TaxID=2903893 RepID=UPI00386D9F76